jgi:hypothetical protein
MESQSLSFGRTRQQKYEGLGGHIGHSIASLDRVRAVIASMPKVGKSTLLQSCEDAFIFNIDQSSTVTPTPRAVMFPMVGEDGSCLLDTGPGILTWDAIESKIDVLKKLAQERKPRPKLVVFDSLSTLLNLVRPWIVRNAARLGIAKGEVSDFKQLHGPAAYDALFETIVKSINDLYQSGYGVILTVHIVNAKIQLGEDAMTVIPELCASDGLWKRIYPLMEFVAVLHRKDVVSSKEVETVVNIRGVPTTHKKMVSETSTKVFLSINEAYYKDVSGGRVQFDPIEVPKADGWKTVSDAYEAARLRHMSAT